MWRRDFNTNDVDGVGKEFVFAAVQVGSDLIVIHKFRLPGVLFVPLSIGKYFCRFFYLKFVIYIFHHKRHERIQNRQKNEIYRIVSGMEDSLV